MDAIEDNWLKSPCLVIEPKLDEPIHELYIYLVLATFYDADLSDLWIPFVIFYKDVSDTVQKQVFLFIHVYIWWRSYLDTQVPQLIVSFNDLLSFSLFGHDFFNDLLLFKHFLNFRVKFGLS